MFITEGSDQASSSSKPMSNENNDEADELFDKLCVDLANDRFWESSAEYLSSPSMRQIPAETREDIRSIYRSRPHRIRKRRKKLELDENDPRPHYVDNVAEAYNTGDINKLREVFERQYEPDCVFLQRYTKETPELPAHREFHSCDQMLDYLKQFLEACPDGVLIVSSKKLHIRQDGTSYLVAKLNFNAIWLFNVILRNVITRTKNLLANFNPLSALYNYFITPTIMQTSIDCELSTLDSFMPSSHQPQTPHDPIFASSDTEECIEPDEYKNDNMDVSQSSLGNVSSAQLSSCEVQKEDQDDSDHSHCGRPSSRSSSISCEIREVSYPTSWLSQSSFFAATQAASAMFPYPWMNSTEITSSASTSSQDAHPIESDLLPVGKSPIEVSTVETTFSLQPKRQPHRVNMAVSYVAHINENFKIYKTESFIRGEFSIDWWGKYATRDQDSNSNNGT